MKKTKRVYGRQNKPFKMNSPFKQTEGGILTMEGGSIQDSVIRPPAKEVKIIKKEEKKKMTDKHGNELKEYIPGVHGPKSIGGSVPFSRGLIGKGKDLYDLGKKAFNFGSSLFN